MTATPAYGFRIDAGKGKGGPLQQAMRAGDLGQIKGVLAQRFPELKFAEADTEDTEIAKPTEVQAAPTAMAEAATADEGESTASLYNDYMAGLPAGVRGLVTTDYKGTRGSRLGRGNYSTASMIPGAQVETPAPAPASAPAPSTGGGTTTTYNAPVVGGNWQQYYGDYYGGDVNYGTIGGATEAPTSTPQAETPTQPAGGGLTPAWAKSKSQQPTTTRSASSGLVPSTTQRGTYVAPSSPQASTTAQNVSQAVTSRVESGSGFGIKAAAGAAGDPNKLGTNAVAAIIAAPGSDRKAAEATLRKFEKGKIELTNQARRALEALVK